MSEPIPETRLSVRLKGPLAEHADRQVDSHLFESHSEYIRTLVRRDMEQQIATQAYLREQIIEGYGQFARGEYRERPIESLWNEAMDRVGQPQQKLTVD